MNGAAWTGEVEPRLTLADLLRDRLGLTGTHLGCEQGACGACTVLCGDDAVRACLMLAVQADGRALTTVEGLRGPDGGASRLQGEFIARGALQCGFCTPGFLVSAEAVIRAGLRPSREELAELMGGNICRCTGYGPILEAIAACLS